MAQAGYPELISRRWYDIADEVAIACVEVGIGGVVKPQPGRRKAILTPQQQAERRERAREMDRTRKQRQRTAERAVKAAEGTLRGRGRPKRGDGMEVRP